MVDSKATYLKPEDIQTLAPFQNLSSENIFIIQNQKQYQQIENDLKSAPLLGFDTESKPTFIKGEVSTGPHLIQLSTEKNAYLFQVNSETLALLKPIFSNQNQIKVGFGLKNDAHLFRKKDIEMNTIVDLSKSFSSFGIKHQMGVRNAMALLFKLNFPKSKKISTSNWSKKNLTTEQINYAAADAYAPVLIFKELLKRGLLPKNISDLYLKISNQSNHRKAQSDT